MASCLPAAQLFLYFATRLGIVGRVSSRHIRALRLLCSVLLLRDNGCKAMMCNGRGGCAVQRTHTASVPLVAPA